MERIPNIWAKYQEKLDKLREEISKISKKDLLIFLATLSPPILYLLYIESMDYLLANPKFSNPNSIINNEQNPKYIQISPNVIFVAPAGNTDPNYFENQNTNIQIIKSSINEIIAERPDLAQVLGTGKQYRVQIGDSSDCVISTSVACNSSESKRDYQTLIIRSETMQKIDESIFSYTSHLPNQQQGFCNIGYDRSILIKSILTHEITHKAQGDSVLLPDFSLPNYSVTAPNKIEQQAVESANITLVQNQNPPRVFYNLPEELKTQQLPICPPFSKYTDLPAPTEIQKITNTPLKNATILNPIKK